MGDARSAILERYIRTKLVARPLAALEDDTPLRGDSMVDSMGMVLLAAFVEQQFGVTVENGDVRAGELDSIARILAFVDGRR